MASEKFLGQLTGFVFCHPVSLGPADSCSPLLLDLFSLGIPFPSVTMTPFSPGALGETPTYHMCSSPVFLTHSKRGQDWFCISLKISNI